MSPIEIGLIALFGFESKVSVMAVRNFVFVNGRLLEAIAVMTNKKALFISIPHLEHCLISAELHPVIPLALEPKLSIPHDIDSILMIGGASPDHVLIFGFNVFGDLLK